MIRTTKRQRRLLKKQTPFCVAWKGRLMRMKRIENHPILGETPERRKITFIYNGKEMEGYEGEPVSAALKANGIMIHRYTAKTHEPRGIFCAIGRCTDCVMVINGKPNVRTCITPLEEGMVVETQDGVQVYDGSREER
jgi:hypothetical protein